MHTIMLLYTVSLHKRTLLVVSFVQHTFLLGSTVVLPIIYRDDQKKKKAANRKGIGPTTLKRACNSTTNTRTKYL